MRKAQPFKDRDEHTRSSFLKSGVVALGVVKPPS
jgi:hypothetical protein